MKLLLTVLTSLLCIISCAQTNDFQSLNVNKNWNLNFTDSCTTNWCDNWILDGALAKISNSTRGMDFWAGPINGNDSCHAVLWTKKSFKGDIKIEYDYTRLDNETRNVNIIYIQATGEKPYAKNIHKWAEVRVIPSMYQYFKNMNTIHISYSAYSTLGSDSDYIRARRYLPLTKTLSSTEFGDSFLGTGFFKPNVKHHITIIKSGYDVYMNIKNESQEILYHWNYIHMPLISEGYVGLRHMYTRGSRYSDFKIFTK